LTYKDVDAGRQNYRFDCACLTAVLSFMLDVTTR
jgi:hypothetical protein